MSNNTKYTEPKPAVFMDRDDTLIDDPGFLRDPEKVKLLPGVVEGLKKLREAGYLLVIISNQSGIGRGIIKPEELDQVNSRLLEILKKNDIEIDRIYWCPHTPDDKCDCRKPATGMLQRAVKDLNIDLSGSVMVGDRPSDIKAGKNMEITSILINHDESYNDAEQPDIIVKSFFEGANYIIQRFSKEPDNNDR